MYSTIGIIVFGMIFISPSLCSFKFPTETSLNGAETSCKKNGTNLFPYGNELVSTIRNENFTGALWLGKPWLKQTDCYRDTGSNVGENKTSAGSLYSCSSICGSSEYNYLGLKVNKCVCFKNFRESSTQSCGIDKSCYNTCDVEKIRCGTNDTMCLFRKGNTTEEILYRVLVVTESGFSFTGERQRSGQKIHFVCTGQGNGVISNDKTSPSYKEVKSTTPTLEAKQEKGKTVQRNGKIPQITSPSQKNDMDVTVPAFVIGIAASLPVLVVLTIVVICCFKRKRKGNLNGKTDTASPDCNFASAAGDEYASVMKNNPNVQILHIEDEQIDVYDVSGCNTSRMNEISNIYDHTDNMEGVYDTTNRIRLKTDDVNNMYDHSPFLVNECESEYAITNLDVQTELEVEQNTEKNGNNEGEK